MKRISILITLILLGIAPTLFAKEIKPTLLVYGAGIEAFTAAVQAARSNVATLWVVNSDPSFHHQANTRITISANRHLDSGIWKELLTKVAGSEKPSDSLAIAVKQDLNVRLLVNAMEDMAKKEKMLIILENNDIESLELRRNTWRVLLQNKKRYDIRAIVDASLGGVLRNRTTSPLTDISLLSGKLRSVEELSTGQIRTIIAIGEYGQTRYALPLRDALNQQKENIFFTHPFIPDTEDIEAVPMRAQIGQAIGASAAYCSFFKTNADKIDVRKLQSELLAFHIRLFPWTNISPETPHYMSIQKAYLSTIYGESEANKQPEFEKRDSVHTDSVKTIFNQYYSRSQLWFLDNNAAYFSLGDLLSFIKTIAFRGNEIDVEVQKDWNKKLQFEGEYDLNRTLHKNEFAVLIDRYANPFAKTVTLDGVILR